MMGDVTVYKGRPQEQALGVMGGGLEGASNDSRETFSWSVSSAPPDRIINGVKEQADARATDMALNDGYARGALSTHMDGTVGSRIRLISRPRWRALQRFGADKSWAKEAALAMEERFTLIAESPNNWLDAMGTKTFTGMCRLAVASFVLTGEVLASAEWIKGGFRPCSTALQIVSPTRLRNPDWGADSRFLRKGVEIDKRGKPIAYWISSNHPYSFYPEDNFDARRILAAKPWGRRQIIHILEELLPDQHRGIAGMVAALKKMKMTKHLQEVTLQNAVLQATYAAVIESELPSGEVFAAMGGDGGYEQMIGGYLNSLQTYLKGADNIALDGGAMIPHLFPNTKLNLKTLGTPGVVGTDFEESLIRHTAASLGLNYEDFAKDYRNVSYASGKLSDQKSSRFMASQKRTVVDRFADNGYRLWLEEDIANGNIPLPPRMDREDFYLDPLVMEAMSQCEWIGSNRGQIDELKETQAAGLRVKFGFTNRSIECARLGYDYREVMEQSADENDLMDELGVTYDLGTQRDGTTGAQSTTQDTTNDDGSEGQSSDSEDDN